MRYYSYKIYPMKHLYFYLILLMMNMPQTQAQENSQGDNFLSKVDQQVDGLVDDSELLTFFDREREVVAPRYRILASGSNRPSQWFADMMVNDLQQGVVGALDDLYPGIAGDDIFNTDRRGGLEDVPEMGDLVLTGEPWEASIMWWNAETIGNWWDGYIRHAYMTKDEKAIRHSEEIIQNLLRSQDEDGYIGIYKPNLRYQHEGANGELWAQTTSLRSLLAYYELTGDEVALEAAERAMAVTMREYSPDGRNPFILKNAFGGVTHGLMLTDVCDTLHRITEKPKYQYYATFLYRAFSTYSINRAFNDLRYPFLLERDEKFSGHGVHTYEHFRSLLQAYFWTGYPELKTAWDNALYKLEYTLLPSGAGHGAEWIAELVADPDLTATEYCSMLELRNSLLFALEKTGDISFADHAEILTFNGMMGFRNHEGTAITYNKSDNCCILNSHHHTPNGEQKDVRFKYSPTHSDPAVCCVPNYGRNLPYYLQHMWMEAPGELVAMLYGPSVFETQLNGSGIKIEQVTDYPLSDDVLLKIEVSKPLETKIRLRKPSWCKAMMVEAFGAEKADESDFIVLNKTWQSGDVIKIRFENEVEVKPYRKDHHYFQRGPIVYALPIPHKEVTIKAYENERFRDYHCFPSSGLAKKLKYSSKIKEKAKFHDVRGVATWYRDMPTIDVKLMHTETAKPEPVTLIPMGSTILRKVTF